jgi:hypothetical protein
MVKLASAAVAAERPRLLMALGGISSIDRDFISNMRRQGGETTPETQARDGRT